MQKVKDNLGLIFISLFSIGYLYTTCNLIINFDELKALKLNEKGDVLAGVFSPLAFIWLVYGYLQQGRELQQNSIALKMQAEELRISNKSLQQQVVEMSKSVKAQKDMFELANMQYREALEEKFELSRPRFLVITGDYSAYKTPKNQFSYSFSFIIENKNIPLKNFVIQSDFWKIMLQNSGNPDDKNIFKHTIFEQGERLLLRLYLNQTDLIPFKDERITLSYSDFKNYEYTDEYTLKLTENEVVNVIKYTQPH